MKTMRALFLLVVFAAVSAAAAWGFEHPGARDSRQELDFVKAQIGAGAQPWAGEFDRLKRSSLATRKPHALTTIDSTSKDDAISRDDAAAAYTQALLWYYSGEETYARGAIAILNAWAGLRGFTGGSDQDRLQAGWIGAVFAPAAEIMRLYDGWSHDDIAALQAMFRRAFYPQLNPASTWNGNVDLTQIDALMAIAVFNEDRALFALGLERFRARVPAYFYLRSDGARPRGIAGDGGDVEAFWSHPEKWVDGLMQETCRDGGHHAQFALGSALHAAEVAWHQGVDLYSENNDRFTAAMELLATQLLTGSMQGVSERVAVTRSLFDSWEIGFNHYHRRVGIELPMTRRLILERIRPEAPRAVWNLNYETLTHGDLPGSLSPLGGDEVGGSEPHP